MRRTVIILAVAALAMAAASTALAGGWAVTSFEDLPEKFEAGTTYTLDYTVRAHGKTPVDAGPSQVVFRQEGSKPVQFDAVYVGDGRYRVEVTLPSEGTWAWEVTHGYGPQELGTIEVSAAAAATASGFDATNALKVILPLATLAAAVFTIREWTRTKAGSAPAQTG